MFNAMTMFLPLQHPRGRDLFRPSELICSKLHWGTHFCDRNQVGCVILSCAHPKIIMKCHIVLNPPKRGNRNQFCAYESVLQHKFWDVQCTKVLN